MANPFSDNNRDPRFDWYGLASDWIKVTPSDATAVLAGTSGQLGVAPAGSPSAGEANVGIAFYAEVAGDVEVYTPWGGTRVIPVNAKQHFQMAIRGIKETNTTATGIHVAVVY